MNNTLLVFSTITTHLVSLTGYNEYGHLKSKGIQNYADLADELNQEGILSSQGNNWTENSLKCFLSRCRRNYPKHELKQLCPLELVGAQHYEFLAKDERLKRGRVIRFNRSLYQKNVF
jgi:hypothetical protein